MAGLGQRPDRWPDPHLTEEVAEEGADSASLSAAAVAEYLATHPGFAERWLRARESRVELRPTPSSTVTIGSRNSITDEMFRDLLDRQLPPERHSSVSPLLAGSTAAGSGQGPGDLDSDESLDESQLMIELIRDISGEFDIQQLCRKIMKNVGLLTKADRGSLFLAKGSRGCRYLMAKVFDVVGADEESVQHQKRAADQIRIPFGTGIAGYVAQTREAVNLQDAYQDPRFSPEVDERTGYRTGSLLCLPITNHCDEVIGVAQIINKQGQSAFTENDVQIFQKYLVFCGIGLQNAQLFDLSISEFKKNQTLLNLARGIFEEQSSLENLVQKIMREAADLLRCRQVLVFLREDHCRELQSVMEPAYDLRRATDVLLQAVDCGTAPSACAEATHSDQNLFQRCFSLSSEEEGHRRLEVLPEATFRQLPLHQLALRVLHSGQAISGTEGDEGAPGIHWQSQTADSRASAVRSLLSIPIHNQRHTIIGVAHFINKEGGFSFTEQDLRAVETFGLFCGLGIHNSQMYEHACRLMAKQRVALECLSYHATASDDSAAELATRHVPSAHQFNLYSFEFDDLDLDTKDTCIATIRMFKEIDMIRKFRIPYEVLCRWILSVKKNYRPVTYHNWRHALNVTQTMFYLLSSDQMIDLLSDQEMLGLMVACLCHDLDHRGTNNAFQSKTDSPLATLYSTSTMEHHHFDQCVMILNSEGNNIFQVMTPEDYRAVIDTVRDAILSTDLEQYFKKKDQFLRLAAAGETHWQNPEKKKLLMGMLMTACDVSAIAKPWKIQHRVAKQVADEFFYQGDLERTKLNATPIAMMDRERRDELPKMQMSFINSICIPLYKALSEAFPWMRHMYEGCLLNLQHWQYLADQVDIGLTWIDHDSIEEPVETSRELTVSRITLQGKSGSRSPKDKLPDVNPELHQPRRSLSIKSFQRLHPRGNGGAAPLPQSRTSHTVSQVGSPARGADRRSSEPAAALVRTPGNRGRSWSIRRQQPRDHETRLCAIS